MRIIHFVESFSQLTEKFIYDYLISLRAQQVDVEVITFHHINKKERPFEPVYHLEVERWNIHRVANIVRDWTLGRNLELSGWPVRQKKLKRMLTVKPPDALHAHFGPMGVFLGPVAKALDIPLVVTFYGYDISRIVRQDYWRKQYKELAKIADRVTVLSEEMKGRALKLGFRNDQIEVVHLGSKLDEIDYRPPSYPIHHFLSVGRLTQKKGHLDTLKAFGAVLKKSKKPLHLTIIGGGEDQPKMEAYIQSQNLRKNVTLPGSMNHNKVRDYLYKADAFILNSKTASNGDREGTPTVLVEAQAAGLPCISTFHAGIPEMIPSENHRFLAEEGHTAQIVSNIQNLIAAPEKEIKEICRLGRRRVEEAFDVEKEAGKFKDFYKKII